MASNEPHFEDPDVSFDFKVAAEGRHVLRLSADHNVPFTDENGAQDSESKYEAFAGFVVDGLQESSLKKIHSTALRIELASKAQTHQATRTRTLTPMTANYASHHLIVKQPVHEAEMLPHVVARLITHEHGALTVVTHALISQTLERLEIEAPQNHNAYVLYHLAQTALRNMWEKPNA